MASCLSFVYSFRVSNASGKLVPRCNEGKSMCRDTHLSESRVGEIQFILECNLISIRTILHLKA